MVCCKCCQRTKSVLSCIMEIIVASICITVVKPILCCINKSFYNKLVDAGMCMAWLCCTLIPDTFKKIWNIINGVELMCGDTLPDLTVYDLDGNERTILSMIDASKFTVLNFGNSGPLSIKHATSFYQLAQRYIENECVAFVYCYVKDEEKELLQAHSINQRIDALKLLIGDIEDKIKQDIGLEELSLRECPNVALISDNMDKLNLQCMFNAIPNRLIVIKDNDIVERGGYGPCFYSVQDIERYLDRLSFENEQTSPTR